MRSLKNTENAIAKAKAHTNERADQNVLENLLERFARTHTNQPADPRPERWRMTMKNPITRLSIAAAIIIAVGTGWIGLWHGRGPAAYAFTQTVEAMQGKRSFHIQTYFQQRRKDEFWAEFDESGNLIRFRQHEGNGPDHTMITIWQDNIMSQYYPPPRGVHLMTHVENTGGGLEGLEEFDPETIVQEIQELVAEGKAIMETQEPSPYADLMTIRVTRVDGQPLKRVLVVDPDTKFVLRIDDYWGQEDGGTIHKGIEVLEYNEAIDPRLFERNFPDGTILMDQVTQEVGMAQGDMTDEEVAAEALRQALDAWTQGDYARAGELCGGVPVEMFTERCRDARPARVISIGQPEPIKFISPRFRVPCEYEVERDGQLEVANVTLGVFAVNGRPGRWYVSILNLSSMPSAYGQFSGVERDYHNASEGQLVALAGMVVDQQNNAVPEARIFASYAAPGQTDSQGRFDLPAPPIDGSQSIGPIDLPMFVWAYTDDDLHNGAWTVIRPQGDPEPVRRQVPGEADDSGQCVEQTHQGVVLTIKNEDDFRVNLPGDPGQLAGGGSMSGNPQIADVMLVTGPADVVTGQVADAKGLPVTDALVVAEEIELQIGSNTLRVTGLGEEWKAGFAAETDGNGRYSLGHLPSCWTQATLAVRTAGHGSSQQVVLRAGTDTTCDIILPEAGLGEN